MTTPAVGGDGLRDRFSKVFGDQGRKIAIARAPGRVNLIGEHTDYNEGFVFPAAVNRAAWVAAQRRPDTKVVVYSATVEEKVEFDLRTMKFDHDHGWANYPKGILHGLINRGWKLDGLHLYLESDVPMGGGLSSSAAIEVATAYACLGLFPYQMDRMGIAKLCQQVENTFIGVKCGIMDQFASCFGRRDHAMSLDCRTMKFEHVPLNLGTRRLLVIDSGVRRKLANAEYNKRREQCTEAAKVLKTRFPQVRTLRDVSVKDMVIGLPFLDPVLAKRAEHVVRENQRVLDAVALLKRGDVAGFGKLMNESHKSLRDLYEVSCPELDTLAAAAQQVPGVLGARMMGGGFGGTVIALAEAAAVEAVRRDVTRTYQHRYGTTPPIEEVLPDDGARELTAVA